MTFELPVFLREMLSELLAFRATFPNAKLDGLTLRPIVAVAPVPLRASAVGELGALLERDTDPDRFPAEVGSHATLNNADLPGWIVSGVVRPVTAKPEPVTAYDEIVKTPFPELEIITGCELL